LVDYAFAGVGRAKPFLFSAWFIIIQNDLYNFSVKRHPSNVKKSLFATL